MAQPEGNSGTTDFVFTVTLSGTYEFPVSVDWATADGSAIAPGDYIASSGMVNFDVGETIRTVAVPVIGDGFRESTEYCNVTPSNPVNASIGYGIGVGTIENDDEYPAVSIADLSADEADAGTTGFEFAVTLSAAYVAEVQVDYFTVEGSATDPEDYQYVYDTISFPAGETVGIATVNVAGDHEVEPGETFEVRLVGAVNCTISDGQGLGTIQNDDLLGCANADGACYHDEACGGRDCDDSDASVYPEAEETNDGADNQCPGDHGFGVVDEASGLCGFRDDDVFRFSWPEQVGATSYEVARSSAGDFCADCVLWLPTSLPYIDDVETPAGDGVFYYLVRPLAPLAGRRGQRSDHTERSFTCPNP